MNLPVVGIIGGGQLARMMAQAAVGLGLPLRLLAESVDSSAVAVVNDTVIGHPHDVDIVRAFADCVDVITFDHEHVPPELMIELERTGHVLRPAPGAQIHAQDKAVMRQVLTSAGFPCPRWSVVHSADELVAWGRSQRWPIIAKATRGGYDGHGVWKLNEPSECDVPFTGRAEVAAVVAEEFVDFARELSVIVVRGIDGKTVTYPVSETVQRDGICVQTVTPAPDLDVGLAAELAQMAGDIAETLGVVGVLAVELMQRRDNSVVINELAMRPHNTGHWTIDGAVTSQFENHLRAVAGLPLGAARMRASHVVMTNVLGGRVDPVAQLPVVLRREPELKVHWYGKSWQPGRKLGHVTTFGEDLSDIRKRGDWAAALLSGRADSIEGV